MSEVAAWLALGICIGVLPGIEIARRTYRDTARRLQRSNELLVEMAKHQGLEFTE